MGLSKQQRKFKRGGNNRPKDAKGFVFKNQPSEGVATDVALNSEEGKLSILIICVYFINIQFKCLYTDLVLISSETPPDPIESATQHIEANNEAVEITDAEEKPKIVFIDERKPPVIKKEAILS
jgi:hypothetical protein